MAAFPAARSGPPWSARNHRHPRARLQPILADGVAERWPASRRRFHPALPVARVSALERHQASAIRSGESDLRRPIENRVVGGNRVGIPKLRDQSVSVQVFAFPCARFSCFLWLMANGLWLVGVSEAFGGVPAGIRASLPGGSHLFSGPCCYWDWHKGWRLSIRQSPP